MNIVLEGVVGSTLYGLAHEGSDVDKLGIFMASPDELLSIGSDVANSSVVQHDPDAAYHELGKFNSLALKCNPTILELLYLPEYTVKTQVGADIITMRDSFLSESAVRNAFGGYAHQQIVKLRKRHDEGKDGFGRGLRYEKHVRHCFRLMIECEQLLRYGYMTPELTEDDIVLLLSLSTYELGRVELEYAKRKTILDGIESVLPDKPDYAAVNEVHLLHRKEAILG